MKFIKTENKRTVQVMIIKCEIKNLYCVVVESYQNYSFTPDYVSKGYKSLKGAKNHFEKICAKYEGR